MRQMCIRDSLTPADMWHSAADVWGERRGQEDESGRRTAVGGPVHADESGAAPPDGVRSPSDVWVSHDVEWGKFAPRLPDASKKKPVVNEAEHSDENNSISSQGKDNSYNPFMGDNDKENPSDPYADARSRQAELDRLRAEIAVLVAENGRVKADNLRLSERLASVEAENAALREQVAGAGGARPVQEGGVQADKPQTQPVSLPPSEPAVTDSVLALPEPSSMKGTPRPQWVKRSIEDKNLTPPQYIAKHYADLIEEGTLTQATVRREDIRLYKEFHKWKIKEKESGRTIEVGFPFPTERKPRDERYKEMYGENAAAMLASERQATRDRVRAARAKQKLGRQIEP